MTGKSNYHRHKKQAEGNACIKCGADKGENRWWCQVCHKVISQGDPGHTVHVGGAPLSDRTILKAYWLGLGLQEYLEREEFLREQAEEVEDGKDA